MQNTVLSLDDDVHTLIAKLVEDLYQIFTLISKDDILTAQERKFAMAKLDNCEKLLLGIKKSLNS